MKLKFKNALWLILVCLSPLCSAAQNIANSNGKRIVFSPGVKSTVADEFAPSFTDMGKKLESLVNDGWTNTALYVSPDGNFLFYSPDKTHGLSMIKLTYLNKII